MALQPSGPCLSGERQLPLYVKVASDHQLVSQRLETGEWKTIFDSRDMDPLLHVVEDSELQGIAATLINQSEVEKDTLINLIPKRYDVNTKLVDLVIKLTNDEPISIF
jgi:hypothetical protein